MFGIVQPCRHALSPELRRQWWGHLCGLCLGLRDGHGQSARAATNVDAVALSVLVEAQRAEAVVTREAGPCPLRGFRSATVVRSDDPGVRHAVAVSLTMAATKIEDHVADRDGWVARVPRAPTAVAGRWSRAGDRAAAGTGLDTGRLRDAVAESARRERIPGLTFDGYVAPTEEAAAQACRHTATLADRPGNVADLEALGRAFGRTVYLVDAVRDLDDDLAGGQFNPLVATVTDSHRRLDVATELLADAHHRITEAFDRLDLPRPALARVLFVDQVRKAGDQALRAAGRPGRHTCRPNAGSDTRSTFRTDGGGSVGPAVSRRVLSSGSGRGSTDESTAPEPAPASPPASAARRRTAASFGLVAGAAALAMSPGEPWVQRPLGPPGADDPHKGGFCRRFIDCCDCCTCGGEGFACCCGCDCCCDC